MENQVSMSTFFALLGVFTGIGCMILGGALFNNALSNQWSGLCLLHAVNIGIGIVCSTFSSEILIKSLTSKENTNHAL